MNYLTRDDDRYRDSRYYHAYAEPYYCVDGKFNEGDGIEDPCESRQHALNSAVIKGKRSGEVQQVLFVKGRHDNDCGWFVDVIRTFDPNENKWYEPHEDKREIFEHVVNDQVNTAIQAIAAIGEFFGDDWYEHRDGVDDVAVIKEAIDVAMQTMLARFQLKIPA